MIARYSIGFRSRRLSRLDAGRAMDLALIAHVILSGVSAMTLGRFLSLKIVAISSIIAAGVVLRIDDRVCAAASHQHKQERRPMDFKKIDNPVVRTALEAWQRADSVKWHSLFAPGARLLDDGSPRDLQAFGTEAIREEYFTDIIRIEDEDQTVIGHFHTAKYGDFIARFHFDINAEGKIELLDISQVDA